jgi:cell division protein ZipA
LAAELRWILLGLSAPLLAGIWWWSARRSRQTAGNAELRESTAARAADPMPPPDPRYADAADDAPPAAEQRDWGVPPFEPLNILTADFDHVPVLDGPMMVSVDHDAFSGTATLPATAGAAPAGAAPAGAAPASTPAPMGMSAAAAPIPAAPVLTAAVKPPPPLRTVSTTGPYGEDSDRFAGVATPAANAAETQRIVTVRVCSAGESLWPGARLMAVLEMHGLAFGRYQVFHRKHADGRSLFCVASLVEPGTFNVAEMAQQEFRGVTLFAVLPGPTTPLDTVDELLATARGLAEELSGMVQDGKGMPLSPQRAAALREDIARFQASLRRS